MQTAAMMTVGRKVRVALNNAVTKVPNFGFIAHPRCGRSKHFACPRARRGTGTKGLSVLLRVRCPPTAVPAAHSPRMETSARSVSRSSSGEDQTILRTSKTPQYWPRVANLGTRDRHILWRVTDAHRIVLAATDRHRQLVTTSRDFPASSSDFAVNKIFHIAHWKTRRVQLKVTWESERF
jgi:hypothetical protein